MSSLQQQKRAVFECKNAVFELKKLRSFKFLAWSCICGSIFCHLVPKIFESGNNVNQQCLFYQFRQDSLIKFDYKNVFQEKSELLLPGKGEIDDDCISGRCMVCNCFYKDYLEHIKSQMHLINTQTNQYTQLIQELVDEFKPIHANSRKIKKKSSSKIRSYRSQSTK